jgi:polysaccharide biosynthesis protein PslJ
MTTSRAATTTTSPQNGALSTFLEPEAGERTPWLLAFLCLLIPILPAYVVPPGPLKSNGSPAKIIAIMLFGLAVLGFVLIRRAPSRRAVRPGVVLILVYFLISLMVYAVGLSHSDGALVEANKTRAILNLLASVGVALYVMTRVKTASQCSILLGCLAIGLTFNCVVGLLQHSTHIDLHLLFRPPGFILNEPSYSTGAVVATSPTGGGVTTIQASGGLPTLTERFGVNRAYGTSGHPIEFSVLAAVTVPVNLHFARYAADRQVRLFAALATGVALLAMPAAVSRSGVIALAAALLVYMWAFTLRQLSVAVVTGAGALLVGFGASPGTAQALWQTIVTSATDSSVLERVGDYTKVSRTFHEHPVFGLGLGGTLPQVYGLLDNEWLQALVQGGIVGLVAMLVLASGGIFGVAAALRGATTPKERDQAYAMGAMLIGILASSYTFDLFSYQQAALLFFILFGLLWSNFNISIPVARATSNRRTFGVSKPRCLNSSRSVPQGTSVSTRR